MKKKASILLTAAAICAAALFVPMAAGASAPATTPPADTPSYNIIDVYEGTGPVDYKQVVQTQQGVWIKLQEGENYMDSRYHANIDGAEVAGIKWGPYIFLRLYSQESCRRQADNFFARISAYDYSLIPAVDCEVYDGNQTADQVRACLRAFVDEFKAQAGFAPIVYSYTSYINNNALAANFTDCPLWQADYRGYSGATGWAGGWAAWQFSSKGILPGINHYVDMSQATCNIFVDKSAVQPVRPQPAQPVQPSQQVAQPAAGSGVYPTGSMPYAYNATAATAIPVLDSAGDAVKGRQIDAGDRICIVSVDYVTQRAEVVYPVKSGYVHGYIKNVPAQYHSRDYNAWSNGKTNEPVYNAAGQRIGTIYPHERATFLYKTGSGYMILYTVSGKPEVKSGLVRYAGGIK